MGTVAEFFTRLRLRTVWSWNGVLAAWRHEHSFRSWVWANLVSDAAAFLLPLSGGERVLIVVMGLMVLAAEALNTAIENTVDYISTEKHDLAGRAKDAGSAAVFLTALAGGVAWAGALWRLIFG